MDKLANRAGMFRLSIVLCVVWVAGCSTPYQPVGFRGGYSDTVLGPNQAIVRFEGNGYTRAGRVQDMALYRCADLTVQRGFDAFVFASSSGDTATGYYVQHGQYSSTVIPIQKHTASATIAMFKKENAPLGAMDARTIMESLGPQLGIER